MIHNCKDQRTRRFFESTGNLKVIFFFFFFFFFCGGGGGGGCIFSMPVSGPEYNRQVFTYFGLH